MFYNMYYLEYNMVYQTLLEETIIIYYSLFL